MKTRLTQTQLNQIFKVQELCNKLIKKAENENCRTYVRGYEVDKENFIDMLDAISASIDNMAENLLNF